MNWYAASAIFSLGGLALAITGLFLAIAISIGWLDNHLDTVAGRGLSVAAGLWLVSSAIVGVVVGMKVG